MDHLLVLRKTSKNHWKTSSDLQNLFQAHKIVQKDKTAFVVEGILFEWVHVIFPHVKAGTFLSHRLIVNFPRFDTLFGWVQIIKLQGSVQKRREEKNPSKHCLLRRHVQSDFRPETNLGNECLEPFYLLSWIYGVADPSHSFFLSHAHTTNQPTNHQNTIMRFGRASP